MRGAGTHSRRGGTALAAATLIAGILLGAAGACASPPDSRGWEMVSPIEKNGGEVEGPGKVAGGGVYQAAANGGSLTYSSTSSFGEPQGAAAGSQYIATRAEGGWSSQNITPPLLSGSYAGAGQGVPYQLFSPDLALGLLSGPKRCRSEESQSCPVASPPPPGSGAPAGYRDYYLRDDATGAYRALITSANAPSLALAADEFELSLAGSSADLGHVILSSCAKLTPEASEIAAAGGCEEAAQNLYEFSAGALRAINILPGESETTPAAALAAQSGAISSDGSRVYFTHAGNLYLRDGEASYQVDQAEGGGGEFQTASADGSLAYFTKAGHLYRFATATHTATDLTPAGEVAGVLGASADGSYVYYLSSSGLFLSHEGTATKVAATATATNYPPATGTSRVSPDGLHLAFLSNAELTGYRNVGKTEVFLYDAVAKHLTCVSCNPRELTPAGPSTIPGAFTNGEGPAATDTYKPRVLAPDGSRIFFNSADALLVSDSDGHPDVYEWETMGTGSCTKPAGCIGLISGGRTGEASLIDSSQSGEDVFFLTNSQLAVHDLDGVRDIYDARVGGGFLEPPIPIPCEGDACQGPAPEPEEPTAGSSTFEGPQNPAVTWPKEKKKHRKHHKKHHGHHHRRHK